MRFLGRDAPDDRAYRPRARFDAMRALRPFVRASIDTSDGLVTAMHTLTSLAGLGVEIAVGDGCLTESLRGLLLKRKLPTFMAAVIEIGDYELLVAVDEVEQAKRAWPALIPVASVKHGKSSVDIGAIVDICVQNRHAPDKAFKQVLERL